MKQIVNGQRVINWHRPLGKDELKQRYLRLKDAPLLEDIQPFPEEDEPGEDMFRSDLYYPHEDKLTAHAIVVNEVRKQMLARGQCAVAELIPQAQLERLKELLQPGSKSPAEPRMPMPYRKKVALIKYFCACYQDMTGEQWEEKGNVLKWFGISEEALELGKYVTDLIGPFEDAVVNLVFLRPFWIRDPEDWERPETDSRAAIESLVRHLLVIFPVQDFFIRAIVSGSAMLSCPELHWFLFAAQGDSLVKAGKLLEWRLNRKYVHAFNLLKDFDSLYQAHREVALTLMKVPAEMEELVLEFEALDLFPLRTESHPERNDFCRQAISWMVRENISVADAGTVVAGVNLMDDKLTVAELQQFSWRGRTRNSVLRYMLSLIREEFERDTARLEWECKGWDHSWRDEEGTEWSMVELCDSFALYMEGKSMHHCVGGYDDNCRDGSCAIFSLRRNGSRLLTVHVVPASRKVEFASGSCNRPLRPEETAMVRNWEAAILRRDEAKVAKKELQPA